MGYIFEVYKYALGLFKGHVPRHASRSNHRHHTPRLDYFGVGSIIPVLLLAPRMAPRFPLDKAPQPDARRVTEEALSSMHGGQPPFQWIEEDGRSLVGCYAPLR